MTTITEPMSCPTEVLGNLIELKHDALRRNDIQTVDRLKRMIIEISTIWYRQNYLGAAQ